MALFCYSEHMSNSNKAYLNFAKQLAYEAGDIMLEHFKIGVDTKNKPNNTPVTIADIAVNRHVIEQIQQSFPDHAVLGEEQSIQNHDAQYVWVCDPIDGTLMYAAGLPVNVFALALVDKLDGLPKVAVVYDPYMQRLYSAVKDGGARVNGSPLKVGSIKKLSDAIVGITSDRSEIINTNQLKSAIIARCARSRAMGSVLYEAMVVATGSFSAQIFVGSGSHDVAAAKLIVEEAGGKVTSIFGGEQRYDQAIQGAIISNGFIHDELAELAKASRL